MKKLLLFFLAAFLISCTSAGSITATSKNTPNPPVPSVYPYPVETLSLNIPTAPYPMNEPTLEKDAKPTLDKTMGEVFGKLMVAGKPVNYHALYPAKVVIDDKGNEIVVNFSRTESILTQPDQEGRFDFVNVPAGRYGFVVDRVNDSVLLTNPGTDITMLITVLSGQSQNLGDLVYDQMPTNNP